jgi:acetylornithine deacetylase/succinyl-diaminopimelate desuccinylase-like protein
VDAEFAVNQDDWSIPTEHGKALVLNFIAGGKLYADYQLVVTNPGGHSSEPVPDNAIYALSAGLTRLAAYTFPFELNAVTRAYYERRASLESGQRAADMRAILKDPPDPQAIKRLSQTTLDNGAMRTTCVATRLEGGHANNALPQRAAAVVNCRILPAHSAEEVRQQLVRVLADPRISVRYIGSAGQISAVAPQAPALPPSPLRPEVIEPLQRIAGQIWPQLQVIPWMDVADSDSVYSTAAGVPTYTFGAVTYDQNDDRAHGRNERVSVEAFYKDNEFFARYLRAISSP